MLTYSFDENNHKSLYQQLYTFIKNDILEGHLIADEKLPSKRTFVKNLGISIITIENAYAQLMAEGYIYSLPKKGFYVSPINNKTPLIPAKMIHKPSIKKESYWCDFSSNQTPAHLFPFTTWSKLMKDVLNEHQSELMVNPPVGGIYELREAISHHLKEFRNMDVEPERIIIGAGTEYLYGLLVQLLGFDLLYAVENPGYNKILDVYSSLGAKCVPIDMDEQGILVNQLEDLDVDIAHISPSHHFPTGIIMPVSRRYELLGWANKKEHRYIIEDDYDSELRLSGQPIPALQSIDLSEKVIYMNTFTKTLASTIRISYMVLPHHLLERYNKKLSFYACTVSNFEQYTLASFINEHYFDKHITKLRNHYHNKRDAIVKMLKESSLKDMITISKEDAGLHFLITIHTHMSDETLINKLKEEGIHLRAIPHYYLKNIPHTSHTFIMNYSSIDLDKLPQAIEILEKILY